MLSLSKHPLSPRPFMLSLSKHPQIMEQTETPTVTKRLLPYALFAALVLLFLWRPIFTGKALLPGDYLARMSPWNTVTKAATPAPQWNPLQWDAIAQFYPWRVFYARSMHQGTIPLWNPYQFSGTPFLANGQSAVLYPFNLLFLIFNPITAFTVYAALHLFLAAAFMYLLLRALGCREAGGIVGGICFAFCAFMVLWLELPTFVGAAVWLPLVLLLVQRAVERRSVFYGMLGGAALAMAFLAGHFQIAFYVVMASCLWWAWKLGEVWRAEGKTYAFLKVIVPFLAFVVVAGLIAAPQVLPTVELARNSHRASVPTEAGFDWFQSHALKPYRLITAFIPDFFGNPAHNSYFLSSAADYIEYGLYIGILPLALALIAVFHLRAIKHAGFFALLALLAILTATGTPINYVFYYLIPGFSSLGGPNRILLVYFLGIAGLAGFGMDCVQAGMTGKLHWRSSQVSEGGVAITAALLAIGTLFVLAAWASIGFLLGLIGAPRLGVLFFANRSFALQVFIASIVVLAAATLPGRDRRWLFPVVVVALIVTDLFAFGINYNPTCERSKVYPKTELTTRLKHIAGNSRIAPINPRWNLYKTPDAILPPNAAMVYGLYDVQGYDSLFTREYKDLSSAIQGEDSSPIENGNMVLIKRVTPLLPDIAKYVLTHEPLAVQDVHMKLLGRWSGVYVYEMSDAAIPHSQFPIPNWSFRLGLFLACVGVGALACVGSYRALRGRR